MKVTSAESVPRDEGNTNVIATRDGADSSGSETGSRMQSYHWNLRDPIESGRVVPAGGARQGKPESHSGLRSGVGPIRTTYEASEGNELVEGRDRPMFMPREAVAVETLGST